jgi:hypothetical protein
VKYPLCETHVGDGSAHLICRRVIAFGLKPLFLEGVGGERAGTRARSTRKDIRGTGTAGVSTDGAFVCGYPGFVGGSLNRRTRQEGLMAPARLSQGTRVCVLLSMAREAETSGVGKEERGWVQSSIAGLGGAECR